MQLTILGTGNVATALGNAFINESHKIIQVYGRNKNVADKLASEWGAESVDDIKKVKPGSVVYLFCLSDDAIEEVAKQLMFEDALCVHTSGAISLTTMQKYFTDCGVFYPVQTISANRKINFKNVPVCIEASNKQSENRISELAKSISNNIHFVNTPQRLFLHLAAVRRKKTIPPKIVQKYNSSWTTSPMTE